jgi:hypothetical protein
MVAASSKSMGSYDDALAYLDLAKQQDPGERSEGEVKGVMCSPSYICVASQRALSFE